MNWTQQDKQRVKGVMLQIAAHNGGYVGIADKLHIHTRATPQAWYTRGRVPLEHVRALIALAPPELTLTPAQLCPDARHLEESPRP